MLSNIPFRPRAQLLLQLGEQLIKDEGIALMELAKNSYDADATEVIIEMIDVDDKDKGKIQIRDNGWGMSFKTVSTIWMEPGNTHKKGIVDSLKHSPMGRLPIGEKGIGRFGVHKLGHRIELVTRCKDEEEVVVIINWDDFLSADYLEDIKIDLLQRKPQVFTGEETGTLLSITRLSSSWTRGMMRKVYRSLLSLNSPFESSSSFQVLFKTNKREWLQGLLTFSEIKRYALYTAEITIQDCYMSSFEYAFHPFDAMSGLNKRTFSLKQPLRMIYNDEEQGKNAQADIDLSLYQIGTVRVSLLVFDRDSMITTKYVSDKKAFGKYLDENGGVSVFRNGIRVLDYGEPQNDWLGLDSKRINTPGRYLSNNIILGAVYLDRISSRDLQEKANREGFIENKAYREFQRSVEFALEQFTTQRNIDKATLRERAKTEGKQSIDEQISVVRKKVAEYIPDKSQRDEIDSYLRRIEKEFSFIKETYLKTANAGISYGIVIHEVEKIIAELNQIIKIEKTSGRIVGLAKHLSRLVDSYAELLRNRAKTHCKISEIVEQALFSVQYRLEAHDIKIEVIYDEGCERASILCSSNLVLGSIINLIDNSIWWTIYSKAKPRKLLIKVTREIDNRIAIVVADTGTGFSLEPDDMIKPFVSGKPNGMGLGLNIVNEIMISQNGELFFPSIGDFLLPSAYENGAIVALVFKEEKL